MKRLIKQIEKDVFPDDIYCICCGNFIDETRTYSICDHCMEHIQWNHAPLEKRGDISFLKCMEYGIYERSMIFSLKYRKQKYIARKIGEIMRDRLIEAGVSADVIVPVPVSKSRKGERGFNQAALISEFLSEYTGIEMVEALTRTRDTKPMRGLGPEERKANINKSIDLIPQCGKMLKNRTVLLIDDFYTTGSTAGECSRAMASAEPEQVICFAFAAR